VCAEQWSSAEHRAADSPPPDWKRRWLVIVKWKLPSYLRQDQVRAFFSVVTNPRDKALFITIYLYGLKVSEACLLQREDVDLERRTIRIWRVKNGYSGEKPLFRTLVPMLKRYLRTRTDDNAALFVGRQGRLSKRWVQALFTRYAALADLPPNRRHVHTMRHYSARRTMPSDVEGHSRRVGNCGSKRRWDGPITRHSLVGSTDC
jgi:integrase